MASKIEDARQRLQREQELIARLRTANVRFSDAQTERVCAIVSAHQAGLSIRRIAGTTGLSSSRIHQLLNAPEAKGIPGPLGLNFLTLSQRARPPCHTSNRGEPGRDKACAKCAPIAATANDPVTTAAAWL